MIETAHTSDDCDKAIKEIALAGFLLNLNGAARMVFTVPRPSPKQKTVNTPGRSFPGLCTTKPVS
jgi:hypothetical protein